MLKQTDQSVPYQTTQLVPYIVNGRVWQWQFLDKEPRYLTTIPVRVYIGLRRWIPKWAEVLFIRDYRTYLADDEFVKETFYRCDSEVIYFDDEGFPCVRGDTLCGS